ncbi:FUSC family protein [Rhodococcus aerolatus]
MTPPSTARQVGAALVRVGPHDGAHRAALRCGVSVGVPLLALVLTGHVGWTVYAAFGAFASVYGRDAALPDRAGMQLTAGAALTAAVGLGATVALLPGAAWWAVVVASLVAVAGAVLADSAAWRPPGPLFLVFGFAVVASVPATAADVGTAVLVAGAAAAFAVVVGSARWGRGPVTPRLAAPDWAGTLRRPGARLHLLRYLLAPLLAGGASTALGLGHAYWAMVAAVVPMAAPDVIGRLVRAVARLAGTAAGLVVAAGLLALHPSGVAVVLLVVVLQVLAELVVVRNYALALVAITPLALLVGLLARPVPAGQLLGDRALDTALGVAVAIGLTLVLRDRARSTP